MRSTEDKTPAPTTEEKPAAAPAAHLPSLEERVAALEAQMKRVAALTGE